MIGLKQIKQMVRQLSLEQMKKLDDWLHELIHRTEESARVEHRSSTKQIVEERIHENKTYRLESIRCGKEKCKCTRGKLHGPYWYSYTREKGKLKSQYIGKKLPRAIERTLQQRKHQ
jgi:hypothetical protein